MNSTLDNTGSSRTYCAKAPSRFSLAETIILEMILTVSLCVCLYVLIKIMKGAAKKGLGDVIL